jgi:hypothetical protein
MSEVGVVHLVRAQNGLQPFTNFLDAYARHPGGVPHELLIVFKGFSGDGELSQYRHLLKAVPHREFQVSDAGMDLRAYSLACRHFDLPYLCFLNSYSIPLDENWLAKLFAPVRLPKGGVAAAGGSWESMYTNLLNSLKSPMPFPRRIMRTLRLQVNRQLFRPFPNYHLRTNAFIISRQLMLEVWPRRVPNKISAYLFENGRYNFAQRVLQRGRRVVVVGRNGQGYEKEDWARSNTFRQANQENLLVADNQTRAYLNADFETRKYLSTLAWGSDARPAQP